MGVYPHVCSMSCLSSVLQGATGGLGAGDLFFLIWPAQWQATTPPHPHPTYERVAISRDDRIISPHIFEVAASC